MIIKIHALKKVRKKILIFTGLMLTFLLQDVFATNLFQVYNDALISDPVYQQAIAQRLSDKEGVPISLSVLLPNISFTDFPQLNRTQYTGSILGESLQPPNQTNRQNTFYLTATQTVFDFGKYAAFMGSRALSKKADATLNTATQDLMTRVAAAYFEILKDEDNMRYAASAREFYGQQYEQINQQYKVGLKTITDVYTARASYERSSATYITFQTQLGIDKENLRVLTGKYYDHLDKLSENFPLVTPSPENINVWEDIAIQQNWAIKEAQYAADAARQNIKQQFAGNLPTVNVQTQYSGNYNLNLASSPSIGPDFEASPSGPSRTINRQVQLNLSVPLFAGGGVLAQTSQAQYDYDVAMQLLQRAARQAVALTRQSYLSIQAGISKIQADRQAIRSYQSSVEGMAESFKVGTATLVDVLNQQQSLLNSQSIYATDRYAYVNNLLSLKKAAGTLGFDDFVYINNWLIPTDASSQKNVKTKKQKSKTAKKDKNKNDNDENKNNDNQDIEKNTNSENNNSKISASDPLSKLHWASGRSSHKTSAMNHV